jgi:hypothetical protein
MGLQVQILALIRRLRAMLSKPQQMEAEREERDRFIQDSITERRRYDQARRERTKVAYPHDAGYSHPQSLSRSGAT